MSIYVPDTRMVNFRPKTEEEVIPHARVGLRDGIPARSVLGRQPADLRILAIAAQLLMS